MVIILVFISTDLCMKMNKISKSRKHEAARIRLRIHRGVRSILKQDELSAMNVTRLKKKMDETVEPIIGINTQDEKDIPPRSLSSQLRSWALDFNLQKRAISALLKILISAGFIYLPKDSRTLLKTPRFIDIETRAGGQYWHNGIANCLSKIFAKLNSDIKIEMNFNIDGLPIFKSSPIAFWPILGNIHGGFKFNHDHIEYFTQR